MEHRHETHIVGAEQIQDADLLHRQLGRRAYQIASSNPTTLLGQQFAAYDLALISEAKKAIPYHVIGQLELPIEFSE